MKVCILYKPNSEHARQTLEYLHDFVRLNPTKSVQLIDVDSKPGTAVAELYDVVDYPAILAINDDGQLLKSWVRDLPLMDELSGYVQN